MYYQKLLFAQITIRSGNLMLKIEPDEQRRPHFYLF